MCERKFAWMVTAAPREQLTHPRDNLQLLQFLERALTTSTAQDGTWFDDPNAGFKFPMTNGIPSPHSYFSRQGYMKH